MVLDEYGHEVDLGDDVFGVVFDLVLMLDELSDDDADVEEGDHGETAIGDVGQLLDLAVGVVEQVENFVGDVLDEVGQVLESEFYVYFGDLLKEFERFYGNLGLF